MRGRCTSSRELQPACLFSQAGTTGGENDSKPIKASKRCDAADARTRFPFAVPFAWSTLSRLIRARLLP